MSLPQPYGGCEVCYEDELPPGQLSRCSVCKNRFYCSKRCQKSDWKKHKVNCSLLPSGPLSMASITPTDEMEAEVERAHSMLKTIADAWKKIDETNPHLPEAEMKAKRLKAPELKELTTFKVSDAFAYDTSKFGTVHPMDHVLFSIMRLFWIHNVAHLSTAAEEEVEDWKKFFLGARVPSDWPQLIADKVMARPADLSVGEYEMIMQMMPVRAVYSNDEKWIKLAMVFKGTRASRSDGLF